MAEQHVPSVFRRFPGKAVLVLCILALTGCARPSTTTTATQFSNFAKVTSAVTANVQSTYDLAESLHTKAVTDEINIQFDDKNFQLSEALKKIPYFSTNNYAVRMMIINGLNAYARSLAAIMSAETISTYNTSVSDLGTALTKLASDKLLANYFTVDINVSDVAKALGTLGQWIIDAERQKAVTATVKGMQQPIREICKLLASDIGNCPDNTEGHGTGICSQLFIDYDQLIRLQQQYINRAKLSIDKRKADTEKLTSHTTSQNNMRTVLIQVKMTIEHFALLHDSLLEAFQQSSSSLTQLLDDLTKQSALIKISLSKLQ